jgi:hypothetical protein
MDSFTWFDFARIQNDRHTRRSSSWDPTGSNRDRLNIADGETFTLLDVRGPGCITHIWFTAHSIYPLYLRTLLLRIYWDGEDSPSVIAPVGDFFGVGHGTAVTYSALPMVMAPRGGQGLNCYLPMPFSQGARIEVTNEWGSDVRLYYNIDYERWDAPQESLGRLHACWRRENPTDGIQEPAQMADATYRSGGANLSDAGNYLLLEAEGQGQYIGCNLNIHTLRRGKGASNWYGEGDEMIFIDDDNTGLRWPPTLHGTGTEDYFNTAWAPQERFESPFFGITLSGGPDWSGFYSWYRWHLLDPARFTKSIRVSIEHGHANRRSDDFSSTAYWYQLEPHRPFGILPVEARFPRADFPELPPVKGD